MGIFNRSQAVTSEPCDRCPAAGRVRVAKDVVAQLNEPRYADGPLHVDTQRLDLVFCRTHYDRFEQALRVRRWQVLDDRR